MRTWRGRGEDVARTWRGTWRGRGEDVARTWRGRGEDVARTWRGRGEDVARTWRRANIERTYFMNGNLYNFGFTVTKRRKLSLFKYMEPNSHGYECESRTHTRKHTTTRHAHAHARTHTNARVCTHRDEGNERSYTQLTTYASCVINNLKPENIH